MVDNSSSVIPPKSANLLILGDSFVSRLRDHIVNEYKFKYYHTLPNPPTHLPEYIKDVLKAPPEINIVHCYGVGGTGVTHFCKNQFQIPRSVMLEIRPRYAILDIGGNDADSPAPADDIAKAKVDMAKELAFTYDVRRVAITTILPRDRLRHLTVQEFREKVDQVNKQTSSLASSSNQVLHFHRHKGFWRDTHHQVADTSSWSTDGVHPNDEEGMTKFKKSITKCIHTMIKTCHNLDNLKSTSQPDK